jgi:hypothetical protein
MRRDGSVLLIVLGLLAIVLAAVTAFLALMRADAEESGLLVGQARARIMLVAACQYLQETSRLGWSPLPADQLATDAHGEILSLQQSFGWTDVRDGSLGPRGPQPVPAAAAPGWWPTNRTYHSELQPPMLGWPLWNASRPPAPPWWWKRSWPPYPTGEFVRDADLPTAGVRSWPCPGSVLRVESYVMNRPPAAIMPYYTCNPAWPIPEKAFQPNLMVPARVNSDAANVENAAQGTGAPWADIYFPLMARTWGNTLSSARTLDAANDIPAYASGTGFGALDPQPASDTWPAFIQGDPIPRAESLNQSWFRLYRELPSDHDNDGIPYFDRVPLRGHGVFIIACGAGGSLGYRFWDSSEAGFSRDLEAQTAEESGLFPDRQTFEYLRARSVVLWYRVQWSGATGGGFDGLRSTVPMGSYTDDPWGGGTSSIEGYHGESIGTDSYPTGAVTPYAGMQVRFPSSYGNIAWIQRLDQEPPRW